MLRNIFSAIATLVGKEKSLRLGKQRDIAEREFVNRNVSKICMSLRRKGNIAIYFALWQVDSVRRDSELENSTSRKVFVVIIALLLGFCVCM